MCDCVCACACVCMCLCIPLCIYVCVRARVCMYVCVRMLVCIHDSAYFLVVSVVICLAMVVHNLAKHAQLAAAQVMMLDRQHKAMLNTYLRNIDQKQHQIHVKLPAQSRTQSLLIYPPHLQFVVLM